MIRTRLLRHLSAGLLLLGPVMAHGQGLQTAVTGSDLRASSENLDAEFADHLAQPIEEWRQRAAESAQRGEVGADADDDFLHLVRGIRFQVGSRNLADEYVATLSDNRLESLVLAGKDCAEKTPEVALSRLRVAEAVLDRPSMSAAHPHAAYEVACMVPMTINKPAVIRERIAQCEQSAAASSEYQSKIRALSRAMVEPVEAEDFVQGKQFVDNALAYGARAQGSRVCYAAVKKLNRDGVTVLNPANFGGDDRPLRCAAMLCFNLYKHDLLAELLASAESQQDLSLDALTEVRFWAAMGQHAAGSADEAIALFRKNLESGSSGYFTAASAFRAGETYLFKKDWVNAAVFFDIAATDFPSYPDIAHRGAQELEFVLNSGLAERGNIQAAIDSRRQSKTLSMNTTR